MKKNKYYISKIKKFPCFVCGKMPVDAHHLKDGKGFCNKADDIESMPLCPKDHHDLHFKIGVSKWEEKYGKQEDIILIYRYKILKEILDHYVDPEKELDKLKFTKEEAESFVRKFEKLFEL
jgi:hypothetical protein